MLLCQVAINIIEGYIILGGLEFLRAQASSIAKLLDSIVGNVNDRGLLSTLPVVDILIQVQYDSQIHLYLCYVKFASLNNLVPIH